MDFWQGEHIRLRGVEPSDADTFWEWNQDTDMNRFLDQVWYPGSRERQRRWAEKTATTEPTNDGYFWVIEAPDGQIAGSISTHDCDRRTGTFSYGVSIRRTYQRKGYASDAIRIVMRYFFAELRYQKCTICVHAHNPASIRLHEHLGFQLEGRLRRMVYTDGEFFDELVFGMTAEENRAADRNARG
jgi:RimJ/RimL family protein N-acetyltransferase